MDEGRTTGEMPGPGGAAGSIFWPAPVCTLLLGARMGPGKNVSRGPLAVSSPDLSSCSQMFVPGTFLYVVQPLHRSIEGIQIKEMHTRIIFWCTAYPISTLSSSTVPMEVQVWPVPPGCGPWFFWWKLVQVGPVLPCCGPCFFR